MVKNIRNVAHLYIFQMLDGLYLPSCYSYMSLGIAGEELKMPRCGPLVIGLYFYLWIPLIRSCFLFYKQLYIFPKLEIFRKFWAILCHPLNSSVAKSLLRCRTAKQSVTQELRNVPLDSIASKCSSDVCTFCWRIVGTWRLGVHYVCNSALLYFILFCVKVFFTFWGSMRESVVLGIAVFSF